MTEEQMKKIIANAVEAALVDVHKKLDDLEALQRGLGVRIENLREGISEEDSDTFFAVQRLAEQIEDTERWRDLEAGRAELRQARLLGKVAS